ncbi:hypothetical protein Tco_0857521 [Tanacetum coccineum]|uniref:Uncharacterized protein n=1 Tax=Tanacetum coccineum TaxID=301880 RepID=A0ABQ5BC63_9ASTR
MVVVSVTATTNEHATFLFFSSVTTNPTHPFATVVTWRCYDDDDDELLMMMVMTAETAVTVVLAVVGQQSERRGKTRVEESEYDERLDRAKRNTFGFGRKSEKVFSAAVSGETEKLTPTIVKYILHLLDLAGESYRTSLSVILLRTTCPKSFIGTPIVPTNSIVVVVISIVVIVVHVVCHLRDVGDDIFLQFASQ